MVEGERSNRALPQPGEEVEVTIGGQRLLARVLQSYATGAQPRVLLELKSMEPDERVTITMPPESLQPAESAHSLWADAQRYEAQFSSAVARLFPNVSVERPSPFRDIGVDLILSSGFHRAAVETKYLKRQPTRSSWSITVKHLQRAASTLQASALLVTNIDVVGKPRDSSNIDVIRWNSPDDDPQLEASLAKILAI